MKSCSCGAGLFLFGDESEVEEKMDSRFRGNDGANCYQFLEQLQQERHCEGLSFAGEGVRRPGEDGFPRKRE